jgi:glucose-6-phosphate 1-dehydrogenase
MATALVATGSNAKRRRDPELRSQVIVLFGATGDLARRKLLPGLFHLSQAGLLPDGYRVVGASVEELSNDEFREFARAAVEEFGRLKPSASEGWDAFIDRVSYVGGGFGPGKTDALAEAVAASADELGEGAARLFFMAVPPVAFGPIAEGLGSSGLAEGARVIMEKPFGTDHASARALNATVHSVLDEEQVFRIDHFLGKETVQNILALRFANGMFEPIWNRNHIDHVQIDVPETLGVGQRAGFYEATGAFRDMIVTHLLQVLGFVAMEPPASLAAKALVDEKVKVFQAMRPIQSDDVVRGQYEGYRDHDGVAADSQTDTLVAGRVYIDNWRWAGVPFYFRTGKRMAEGKRVITIAFKDPPRQMFEISNVAMEPFEQNHFTFDLGDNGGITSSFLAKIPGPTIALAPAHMDFSYGARGDGLEAYERLIHDAMTGDKTLFTRADGIERLWEIATPVLERPPPVHLYPQGSWGPNQVHELIAPRHWHLPADHA